MGKFIKTDKIFPKLTKFLHVQIIVLENRLQDMNQGTEGK